MASINGVLSPTSNSDPTNSSITLSAKRKRDDSPETHDHIEVNGTNNSNGATVAVATPAHSRTLIRDLVDVLKSYDTLPSILTRTLPERTSSDEPQAKRQKADGGTESPSILSRLSTDAYNGVEEVLEDVDSAVNDIMDKLQLPTGTGSRTQYGPDSEAQLVLSSRVTGFKKLAHELVEREKASTGSQTVVGSHGPTNMTSYLTNGGLGSNSVTHIKANSSDNKVVLTLFGNAPGPKQLFSSLQSTRKFHGEYVIPPLREAGLPNGITTTQIVPIQSTGLVDDRKGTGTLGEFFPTPSTLQTLQPPKPSKIATTRSSTVGWYQPSAPDARSKTGSYFSQSVSTGQWLDYSNASTSQTLKKKQRDRAFSLGGGKAIPSESESAELEAAKLDALFRSAYTGFAPTKDDSAAIIPERVVNRIWWQRIGGKNFERLVENEANLNSILAAESDSTHETTAEEVCDIEQVKEAVEKWNEEVVDPSLLPLDVGHEKSAEEKDVEEILQEISELLETLNSYQRIRHLSLNPSARSVGALSSETSPAGTPSKPSEAELATYNILKSQLALMIATLPPYAVAKLDSDRLAELSISTKIEIRMDDYKGVMEEDEAAARVKVASLSASTTSSSAAPSSRPAASASAHRTSSTALYGNQYAPSRSVPPAHQYYGSAQTPIRPPSTGLQRPPSTTPVPYPAQRSSSGASYRPGQFGGAAYPHQTPRPLQQYPQYTPSAQAYNRSPSQGFPNVPQSAPQANMNTRYGPTPGPYQQQPQGAPNGTDYRYSNGANAPRQTSPQKPQPYSPQMATAQPQSRPSYSTPTPSMSQDRRPYLQNPINQHTMLNGASSQSSLAQHQQQVSTPYTSAFMTTEQQASLMERQRAQLAQQQGTQHQARTAAQANALGASPTKAQVNGGSAVIAGL